MTTEATQEHDTPVLIAGGGPVGMTLALFLAHHGIPSVIAERNAETTRHPKMDLTNGRSMELFRVLNLVEPLREVGAPMENPFDISWVTTLAGHELHRFEYPSATEGRSLRERLNDGSLTLEAPLRVSQIVVEPVLKQACLAEPLIDFHAGWSVEDLAHDSEGVSTSLRNTATGEPLQIRSRYLVGCDGGRSTIRSKLRIKNDGEPNVAAMHTVHFRSEERDLLQRFGTAWHYQNGGGVLVAQDDKSTWTLHSFWPPDVDRSAFDPSQIIETWVGRTFDHDVLVANPWNAHYLVAQQYQQGPVFLAGDAAHQFMPVGGYGMNSGIADAANLAWKLAAVLQGWGGSDLLASYDAERRPVAHLSWHTSEEHLKVRVALGQLFAENPAMHEDTAHGSEVRKDVAKKIAELGNAENECWGTEHGYRYESTVIAREDGIPPELEPTLYTPSTWPGSRLPAFFNPDGTAMYDELGRGLTLLVADAAAVDTDAWERAAVELKIPFTCLRFDGDTVRDVLEQDLILVRPDHHVAWRGHAGQEHDPREVLRMATGQHSADRMPVTRS